MSYGVLLGNPPLGAFLLQTRRYLEADFSLQVLVHQENRVEEAFKEALQHFLTVSS